MEYSVQALLHIQVELEDAYNLYISEGGDHSKGIAVDNRNKVKDLADAIKILTEHETSKDNSFTAKQVVNELNDCETIDDAIRYFDDM